MPQPEAGTGTEAAGANIPGGRVWLRDNADIRPGAARPGTFSYSTDGTHFIRLGPPFTMGNDWRFFMGYRYAIFNGCRSNEGAVDQAVGMTLSR